MKPFLILASLAVLAGCGTAALTPDQRAQVVQVAPGGDPLSLVNGMGFQFADSQSACALLQKTVRDTKLNTGAIFSEGVAKELKAAGVFKDVVPSGGTLRLSFSDFNVQYNDGDFTMSLPVYVDASVVVQLVQPDGGVVWSSRIWSQGSEGRKEKLEDLASKPELLQSFLEDFSRRFARELARKMTAASP